MKMVPTYLLNGDDNYKILILYILRTLNIDIKREIYDLLLIEKIREQAKKEIKQIEEVKDNRIQELQKELERLKQLYEEKLRIKEENKKRIEELKLNQEIEKMKTMLEETEELPELLEQKNDEKQPYQYYITGIKDEDDLPLLPTYLYIQDLQTTIYEQ